ncbi:YheC/YheD family protein [Tepidibacillus sp. HK-1]|uniref:YheC/YheD family endospore coat-associated protein n=1 Tax=Tepidibacillus sp. HK-1 TaxID=1883407 RepID=UPI0008538E68|nr:YheC/YheD family protein [Tepidibacillus sp. HK-1]GBF11754.1 endospore coat-associated protein YheD [Tepidibacillus sp. HK-1]
MVPILVNIKTVDQHKDTIWLSKSLLQQLHLTPNQTIPIYFGLKEPIMVRVLQHQSNQDLLLISSLIEKKIKLPYHKKLMIKRDHRGLQIGPIIGILTSAYSGTDFLESLKHFRHPFSKFFFDLLKKEGSYPAYYFVFQPGAVNWRDKTVKGIFLFPTANQKKTWEYATISLPDVVYNRVLNRGSEQNQSVQHFKQQYLQYGGKLFNYNFFNKWEINKILANDPTIKSSIPEAHINPSLPLLKSMLKKYPIVYLKPAGGSLGKGIYKITKTNNAYTLQFRNRQFNQSFDFKQINALFTFLTKQPIRLNRYIIQQGITLVEYQHRPVDFRVQLHKNKRNQWKLIAIGAKAAGKGSVTTHIRTGGQLINASEFIKEIFKQDTSYVLEEIQSKSIQIAKYLEQNLNQPLGELGLDVGVDKNHHVWLFEVNSKPGRSIFKHPSLKQANEESIKSLLEYPIYLSGF